MHNGAFTSGSARLRPYGAASSIVDRIANHAQRAPQAIALDDDLQQLTFGELEAKSRNLGAHLRSVGAGPESCFALFFERSIDYVVAALAILRSGAAYLPLDPTTPSERIAMILGDADAHIVLTHRQKANTIPPGHWRIIDLDAQEIQNAPAGADGFSEIDPDPASLAYVIYTSGSTGRPKGVEITHSNLLNLIEWHQKAFGLTLNDRGSHVAGLGFDAAAWEIWPCLTAGATLHIPDEATRRSPQALRDWLVAKQISVSFIPTVMAQQLLHTSWPPQTALRFLLTGADTLHKRPIEGLPFVLVNNYGPTECTVVATSGKVTPASERDGPPSIGSPIANTAAFILDESLLPVPDGEPGELYLAGAHVGRGYRKNAELTAAKFVNYTPPSGEPLRIYRTGDRAKVLPNGEIAFLGRMDDQVKLRGYRVELGEIVACLDRYPGIDASAVLVHNQIDSGPTLVGYVVPSPEAKLNASDLRDFLGARLPDYMVPGRFVAISSLPMTRNGKLDKSALPAPTAENVIAGRAAPDSADIAANAPANSLEGHLSAMVASLLGHPSVNRDDNFFMLGGHSMFAVQLTARIRDVFGVKLTLRQLFIAPTIAALSTTVANLIATAR